MCSGEEEDGRSCPGQRQGGDHNPHHLLLVFQVLLFSFCLLLVPAMYSSDTRGSVPAEYVGKRLRDTFKAWAVVKGFFCVVS